ALAKAEGPVAKLVAAFPETLKPVLGRPSSKVTAENEREIVHALNLSVKGPPLWTDAAFKDLAAAAPFQEELKRLPAAQKDLVEAALPGVQPLRRSADGPETILAYRARGELIGEMGLLRSLPRSATCVAYIHASDGSTRPKRDQEAVELVHLPTALFTDLLQDPKFARKVDTILAERLASDKKVLAAPVTATGMAARQSERFEELGLVQGQRLMLIDL